jgi:hypothetical protein
MTADAAPVLLQLAETAPETKHQVRALRGFIRIARQFILPDEDRLEMCRAALQVAKRDAEKKLLLEVLERYPSPQSLELAVEIGKAPALRERATSAALAIAQKIDDSDGVHELLSQLGQRPVKIEIIKAEYGASENVKDVTDALRQHVRNLALVVLPASYNASFGGDPAPGLTKQLRIEYKINEAYGEATFAENAAVLLPIPAGGS